MDWLKNRFRYAGRGFKDGVFKDRSIRLQLVFGAIVIICGLALGLSASQWLWILLAIALVVAGEIFNSCIEKTVDYISLKRDPRAALIKDMAAAGVSVLCLFATVVGIIIFLSRLTEVLS